MTTLERLYAALNASPQDHALKLMIADLLDEAGEHDAARCWRWLGEAGKWPEYDKDHGYTFWSSTRDFHGTIDDWCIGRAGSINLGMLWYETPIEAYHQAVANLMKFGIPVKRVKATT